MARVASVGARRRGAFRVWRGRRDAAAGASFVVVGTKGSRGAVGSGDAVAVLAGEGNLGSAVRDRGVDVSREEWSGWVGEKIRRRAARRPSRRRFARGRGSGADDLGLRSGAGCESVVMGDGGATVAVHGVEGGHGVTNTGVLAQANATNGAGASGRGRAAGAASLRRRACVAA